MARGAKGSADSAPVGVSFSLTGGTKLARALEAKTQHLQKGPYIKVGFLEDATYPNGLRVAQAAFWNEFGTKRAPPRPFFRTTIAQKSGEWGTILSKALVYYKMDSALALAALGTVMQSDIRESIVKWTDPPNAASTIARKGFNKPLIDTGVMQRKVDYRVMNK